MSVETLGPAALEELKLARLLVADLLEPNGKRYWTDLAAGAAVGWGAFGLACAATSPFWTIAAGLISALALYRIFTFMHELTHLRPGSVPGFRTGWNLAVGVPMLLPSIFYEGVHLAHHHNRTYGTKDDPEYLPLAGKKRTIVALLLFSFVAPLVLLGRFLLLAPLSHALPALRRWLDARSSSYTFNPGFVRRASDAERRDLRRWELAILAFWAGVLGAAIAGWLPAKALAVWYGVYATIALVNRFRALLAHRYELDGEPVDRMGQLRDSIDHPGGFWTELWAPLGLRYHALHHLFPTLPYHHMAHAYRRLIEQLPAGGVYREAQSAGSLSSWRDLFRSRPAA
ncbi:MAG TPA: fatty acid desaturase [Planctomycetia bacterium]|nr:fatty acid desaturase [Planctomycetia bacterium]